MTIVSEHSVQVVWVVHASCEQVLQSNSKLSREVDVLGDWENNLEQILKEMPRISWSFRPEEEVQIRRFISMGQRMYGIEVREVCGMRRFVSGPRYPKRWRPGAFLQM